MEKIRQHSRIDHTSALLLEDRIRKETIKIGGKDAETLIKEMQKADIFIADYDAMYMLKHKDFTTLKAEEDITLIHLKVGDLGINKQDITVDEIYRRIEQLGLELCPAEVAPNYMLQHQNQPLEESFCKAIGMKQIPDHNGDPHVFRLVRGGGRLWLFDYWAFPMRTKWNPDREMVFRLR